ncbi:MAG: pirin family protein [Pseudoalteromonas prydzensis]|uniref:Pirin family protein n=1 Tax=Pseudoalteromonas prydzensis TaxID=182141 RepID=A0ABR9FMU4_9GAMM|nr:pirin family protein [Pseudoalteromonas prydzensis]MBE0458130.1 pirin family protein [Pseudoalteromonas prydzensis]
MHYIRKADERGQANLGWLQSKHSFSFGRYLDPKHMGVSTLRVINEDIVSPGQGFGTHGHRDMEIISYVISGALKHKDSTGNEYIVPAGDIQRMSAGSGIMHSEYNASNSAAAHFLQIWIQPKLRGITPSYQQKSIIQTAPLTPLVTPNGEQGSVSINQDASLYRLQLTAGQTYNLQTSNRKGYFHVISGSADANTDTFSSGDAFALSFDQQVTLTAKDQLEALWFDLPA